MGWPTHSDVRTGQIVVGNADICIQLEVIIPLIQLSKELATLCGCD